MDGWMDGGMEGGREEWREARMEGGMEGWMDRGGQIDLLSNIVFHTSCTRIAYGGHLN